MNGHDTETSKPAGANTSVLNVPPAPDFDVMDMAALASWYEEAVGYNPVEDDPSTELETLRANCKELDLIHRCGGIDTEAYHTVEQERSRAQIAELVHDLRELLARIDALPRDICLPAMPGFDRDHVECLLANDAAPTIDQLKEVTGWVLEWIAAVPEQSK